MNDTKYKEEWYCCQFYCHVLKLSILSQAILFNRSHVLPCKIPIYFILWDKELHFIIL